MLQGVGIAAVIPSALSLVPALVTRERQGLGLAFMGSAHNLTMGVLPPLSPAILSASSMRGVALFVLGAIGLAMIFAAGIRKRLVGEPTSTIARAAPPPSVLPPL